MKRYNLEEKEFSEINITPFTDVVLVLLIIFMIASPFLISGAIKIKLPASTTTDNSTITNIPEVYLNANNEIFVNGKKIKLEELSGLMRLEFFNKNTKDVIIKADNDAIHGNVVHILDALKEAGAVKLLIATSKKQSN